MFVKLALIYQRQWQYISGGDEDDFLEAMTGASQQQGGGSTCLPHLGGGL